MLAPRCIFVVFIKIPPPVLLSIRRWTVKPRKQASELSRHKRKDWQVTLGTCLGLIIIVGVLFLWERSQAHNIWWVSSGSFPGMKNRALGWAWISSARRRCSGGYLNRKNLLSEYAWVQLLAQQRNAVKGYSQQKHPRMHFRIPSLFWTLCSCRSWKIHKTYLNFWYSIYFKPLCLAPVIWFSEIHKPIWCSQCDLFPILPAPSTVEKAECGVFICMCEKKINKRQRERFCWSVCSQFSMLHCF